MSVVGYEFLRQSLSLTGFAVSQPVQVRPVTRVMPANGLTYAGPHNCACYPEASKRQQGVHEALPC